MKTTERDCFFSIFQMNDRFMEELKGGDEEYEYAEMQLIVTKVIKVPPKTGQNQSDDVTGECAYIDGLCDDLYNTAAVKIDKMTAGKYLIFYTANFNHTQLCRRLNVVFYAPHEVPIKRVSAKQFGAHFLQDLEFRNQKRHMKDDYV